MLIERAHGFIGLELLGSEEAVGPDHLKAVTAQAKSPAASGVLAK
jgi:hypothetical protein